MEFINVNNMWNWLGASNDKITTTTKVDEKSDDVSESSQPCDKPEEIKASKSVDNVKEAASQLGNYLYSFANVATSTASKLKESVEENLDKTIIGDFNRENERFLQEKEARRIGDGVPPWVGYHEESTMKRQILALSADERNFLRSPPSGVDFVFDIDHSMPIAIATLKQDNNLESMRFKLVPKRITEENFWRNYFYRVSLIKQSTQLSSMADQDLKISPAASSTESLNKVTDTLEIGVSQEVPDIVGSPVGNEFISDSFQLDGGLSEEEKNQMLGTSSNVSTHPLSSTDPSIITEEWEIDKELQEEMESFELVNKNGADDDGIWEKEIEDMLELDSS